MAGKSNRVLGLWTGAVLLFLYAPIVLVIVYSFNDSSWSSTWRGFTLRWYTGLASNRPLLEALTTSLIVASITTVLATVMGTLAAWVAHRYRIRFQRLLDATFLLPVVMPEILMGVSLLIFFATIRFQLGYTTLIIAHTTFCFPFMLLAVRARLAGMDPSLEEAALDLGATPMRAFASVILPYLRPAIVSGALMSFTLSLDELIISYFVAGPGSQTLPMRIFGLAKTGQTATLNAVSTLLILATCALVIVIAFLNRRTTDEHRLKDAFPLFIRVYLCLSVVPLLLLAHGCGQADSGKSITVLGWSEYVPQAVIDGFEKETGIKVHYDAIDSNEALVAKLTSGATKYDLVQPSEYTVEQLAKAGKLAPLDHSKLPNLKNIGPQYMNLAFDPGNRFSVPYMTGTVGIVVNAQKVTDPVRGFKDLFQEKYSKRIVVVNDGREMVSWALNSLGTDINQINTETLAKARPLLAEWVKLIRVYDSDSPKTSLSNGDCDLGIVWSGEAAKLWQDNTAYQYILPVEGAHMFVDNLAIFANAPNIEAAHQFINYCLRPEVSKLISDEFPYTNPNLEARKLLTQKQLDNPASYPKSEVKLDIFRDIGAISSEIDTLITTLKSGG